MLLTNGEIYSIAHKLEKAFEEFDKYIPAKINFYMVRNNKVIYEAFQDIEISRNNILLNYQTEDEDGKLYIPNAVIEQVNKELEDLSEIEIDLDIKKIKLKSFPDNFELTVNQMDALMFMIEE